MNLWFICEKDLTKSSRLQIGGKAWGLVQLGLQGLRTPLFSVISIEGVKQRIWHKDFPTKNLIVQWCNEIFEKSPNTGLAIRSSAYEEDKKDYSFAGKFLTKVIHSVDELIPTLDEVSEHYEEVLRTENRKPFVGLHGLAIIIQEYIFGQMSGVCFSVEPVNANLELAYCEVVLGKNELLVDGETSPTRVYFCPYSSELVNICEGANGPSSLPQGLIETLANALVKMEWVYRTAVDMEWTWDGEKIWFLQSRPVTVVSPSQGLYPKECSTCWFFDQRFIEPITPITRTALVPLILHKAIKDGLSMRSKTIDFEPFYFGGQIYIPHRIYRELLGGCPKWWLSSDLKLLFPEQCACSPQKGKGLGLNFWIDAFCSLVKYWRDTIFVLSRWKKWKSNLAQIFNQWKDIEIHLLTAEQWLDKWQQWQNLSEEFLQIHRWAILWSNYVFRLGGKYIIRGKECQYPSITSKANNVLNAYLSTHDAGLLEQLYTDFSHRTESLDFISPRWEEWLTGEEENPFFREQIVEDGNNILPNDIKPADREGLLFRTVLQFVHLREEQRFEWEKILYAQKKLLKEIGKRFFEKGILNEFNLIWFMTWKELVEVLIDNKQINISKIMARRHQWCVEHTFVKPLFLSNIDKKPISSEIAVEKTWFGWGVSNGRVKGVAYVTSNPTSIPFEIQKPRILVTPCLNPGQTWCLNYWDGVLLEEGSELSHPAIIAREMNIPMIAHLPNITQFLKTGDYIYMDATSGKVTCISSPLE
ncbi:MAG TPA: PEP/pyruvate-binding domain-containing protein [Candidatus Hydrogenedens sp.]|nr:PEP/pyruvate-binding domain-containing protein [Candidatus Hydrogenedens sp.]